MPTRTVPAARRSPQAGFTLLELMIVVTVLGVLAGLVTLAVGPFSSSAGATRCRADADSLQTANAAYIAREGHDAPDVDSLVASGILSEAPASGVTVSNGVVDASTCSTPVASDPTSSTTSTSSAPSSSTTSTTSTSTTSTSTTSTSATSTSTTTSTTSTTIAPRVKLAGIVGTTSRSGNTWSITLTLSVVDGSGTAVSAAAVTGSWSNGATPNSCTTGGSGSCTITTSHDTSQPASRTWTVASVTKGGYGQAPNAVGSAVCARPQNNTTGTCSTS